MIAVSTDHSTCSLPIDQWPAVDHQLMLHAFQTGDLLDGRGPGSHLAPATRFKRCYGYGRWLRFLQQADLLDSASMPSSRVTTAAVTSFVAHLSKTLSLSSVRNVLEDLSAMLALLQPGSDLPWLRKALRRVTNTAVPVRPIQSRLVPIRELYAAGIAQMQYADNTPRRCLRYRSGAFRDGLAVALLAACPLRRRSFVGLRLDRHLLVAGTGFVLQLAPEDLKGGGWLNFPVPEQLAPWLRRYLDDHRLLLLGGSDADQLWINAAGRPMSPMGLSERIGVLTVRRLGRAVPMHHFRHAAATGMALDDPHHIRLVAALLGHNSLGTSERYYNMAGTLAAAGNYQQQIRALWGGCENAGSIARASGYG